MHNVRINSIHISSVCYHHHHNDDNNTFYSDSAFTNAQTLYKDKNLRDNHAVCRFLFQKYKQKGLMVDNTSLYSISSAHSFVYYKNILCPCSEFCVLKRGSLYRVLKIQVFTIFDHFCMVLERPERFQGFSFSSVLSMFP